MNQSHAVIVNIVKSSLAAAESFPVCQPARRLILTLMWALCCCGAAFTASSQPTLVANFNDKAEGGYGTVITDGGITFSNLDERVPGGRSAFTIEMTTSNLAGISLPNDLTTEGYAPGPGYSLNRFGSMSIGFSGLAANASMDVIGVSLIGSTTDDSGHENTLTLEAFLSGTMVAASQSVEFGDLNGSVVVFHLYVCGVFESFQLLCAGPVDAGENFIGIDNVTITPVPEPGGLMLLGIGLGGVIFASRRAVLLPRKLVGAAYSRYFCRSCSFPRPTRR